MEKELTTKIGHCVQLLLPVLGDPDGLLLASLALGCHALLVSMIKNSRQEFRIQGIQHVEKIVTRRALARRVLIGEVPKH